MTDSALTPLEARVAAYFEGNPSQILADEATQEASRAWSSTLKDSPDGSVPFDVVYTIALLHWCRYNELPPGRDHDDLQVSAVMFSHILRVDPESVPERLREHISNARHLDFQDNVGVPVWGPSYAQTQYPSSNDLRVSSGTAWAERRANTILRQPAADQDPQSLDEAVDFYQHAADDTGLDASDRAVHLSNLGRALKARSENNNNAGDLDEAVNASRAAASVVPDGDSKRPAILLNLGSTLGARFQKKEKLGDLDEAVEVLRTAVELSGRNHPQHKMLMTNLGRALSMRYERTGQQSDLEEAIALSEALQAQG